MSKPTEWHVSPAGPKAKCPICDLAKGHNPALEHRRTGPHERQYQRTHIKRTKRIVNGVIIYEAVAVGPMLARPKPSKPKLSKPKHAPGMQPKTKTGIARACVLLANGKTVEQAAVLLNVTTDTILRWRRIYPTAWDAALEKAMEPIADVVRQVAEAEELLDDVPTFLSMASHADRWLSERGEELFPRVGDDPTLSSFFEDYYLPIRLGGATEGTIYQYRNALRHWRLFTGDPPLKTITVKLLAKFRDALIASPGEIPGETKSLRTVKGNLRHIQTLLDKAGPPGHRNRDAAGILETVPWIKPPVVPEPAPRYIEDEMLIKVYAACDQMTSPKDVGVLPAIWWRSLLGFVANTGLRIGTMRVLEWEDVDLAGRNLVIAGNKLKAKRAEVFPLNDTAMACLEAVKNGDDSPKGLVFRGVRNEWRFYNSLHVLQYEAGLPRSEHFGLHDLRKTWATKLWEHSPAAAQLALGHSDMSTTAKHYVNRRKIEAMANKVPTVDPFKARGGQSS